MPKDQLQVIRLHVADIWAQRRQWWGGVSVTETCGTYLAWWGPRPQAGPGRHQHGGGRAGTCSLGCRDLFSESLRALPTVLVKRTLRRFRVSVIRREEGQGSLENSVVSWITMLPFIESLLLIRPCAKCFTSVQIFMSPSVFILPSLLQGQNLWF